MKKLETKRDTINWTLEKTEVFQQIQRVLTSDLALGIPDVTHPFNLFVDKRSHVVSEVLTQKSETLGDTGFLLIQDTRFNI